VTPIARTKLLASDGESFTFTPRTMSPELRYFR
jgi:hypothetical protein